MARAGMNDPKLAEAVGSTRQQIHKLRHGDRKLTVQWAKRLAPHLDCTWQELIEGPVEPTDGRRAGLLEIFDAMDERNRESLWRIAQSLQGNDSSAAPPPRPTGTDPPPFRTGDRGKKPAAADCTPASVLRLPGAARR
jgi:DNA-binding Xre family transcriptional regulator